MTTSNAQLVLNFRYRKKQSKLTQLIEFLRYMKGSIRTNGSFAHDLRKKLHFYPGPKRLLRATREVIRSEVHVNETGNWFQSFVVEASNKSVSVFSDPSVAPAEAGESAALGYSYAAFFERPGIPDPGGVPFKSFIKGDLYGPQRYRPYFDVMSKAIQDEAEQVTMESARALIRASMPKKR